MSNTSSRRSSLNSDASSVGQEYLVYPEIPLQSQKLKLSIIDQCEVRVWSSYVLCFPTPPRSSTWQTFDALHQGLGRTLVQFPFLAGKISYKDRGRSFLEILIDDNASVSLHYRDASTSGESYAFLKKNNFPPSILEAIGFAPPTINYPVDGNPVFVAQATFINGGVLLFFAHAHQVADATGTGSIVKTWSHHISQVAKGSALTISSGLRDASINRWRLDDGVHDNLVSDSAWPFTKKRRHSNAEGREETPNISHSQSSKQSCVWYISPSGLKSLKKLAYPPDDGQSRWISTMDALTALFWRQISKARAHVHQKPANKTTLFFILNARTRLLPPLRPDGVFNATCKLSASVTPSDFQLDFTASLQQASFQIRKVVDSFSSERYKRYIGYLQSADKLSDLSLKENLRGGPDIVATDHSKLGLYSDVWGPLGKIECVRKLWWSREKPDSQFTVMAQLPDGGLEIMTDIEPEANKLLKQDKELLQFLEFRCE